uniref:FACT complex subunit SSRP1 n=1 Tax=Chenopodium quinoa TaxID=63459 RepID=A0A803LFN3_CHEQI
MAALTFLLRRKLHHQNRHIFAQFSLSRQFSSSENSGAEKNPMIEKILVANRGEIACRIMRTAKKLGVRTVAVYSDADRDSRHVKFADEAVRIGPPPAKLSYLQAIHPGYGFLSENAEFAQKCEDEGLSFIGPPASAIRDMGDKSASKRIMGGAGVPLVPGYHGNDQDIDLMKSEAEKIGYPILIKPTHGGGGKGMRIVQNPNEFVEAFLGARREAAASFGVDTILLEKYITRPRHIEVQIFGDKQGNVIYLYERDCSVQRRHQKIIEEAPAPNVSNEFRSQVGQAAVSAAKHTALKPEAYFPLVGYYNAGTVEFIVDTVSGQFYFMEMNTRLQVEHPVTEMVVGQDLVEWQIRVANGESLPVTQSELPLLVLIDNGNKLEFDNCNFEALSIKSTANLVGFDNGHAFEARIYAENVPKGFLPATGVLHHYRPVPESDTVRVETGVEQGDAVSMHYDPMIAKLVVWGENRATALVAGLPTNINFLLKLANHRAFENGQVETHFIENHSDELFADSSNIKLAEEACKSATHSAMLAAACLCKTEINTAKGNYLGERSPLSIWYSDPPFRVNYCAKRDIEFEWENDYGTIGSVPLKLALTYQQDGSYLVEAGDCGSPGIEVKVVQLGDQDFRVEAQGLSVLITLAVYTKDNSKHIYIWNGLQYHHFRQKIGLELSGEDETEQRPARAEMASYSPGSVTAPMAGLVVKVLMKNEEKVEAGQPVLVMEAMKMEHVVKAPSSGFIHGLQVAPGQQVSDGSILFIVKKPGQIRVHSGGILWKKQGGGKAVEVDKSNISGLFWMKVPRSNQLGVRSKDGLYYKFIGFRDQDVATLTTFFRNSYGITPEEKQVSVSGHNWGEVDLNGNMLTFLDGSKQAFELSLADISQTQMQGKTDVLLEFHLDDTSGANEKDSLMEISFHIPNSNTQFVGDENRPSAQVFHDKIMSMADVDAEEAVVTFDGIAILTPRGRYSVELHLTFLRLQGQANDFKIQYSSVVRLFCLPKSNQPHTFVVITLDPPIRKGQTLYPHIVMQFETDYVVESTLSINEDLLNTKYKDKLEPSYKGLIHDVFTNIMRALSSAKVTRPGKFRSCQDGYAVKSSLKAEDGILYPLEKSFFFLPKPPTLILHEEIDYMEFQRHVVAGSNMHYFDLLVKLKTDQEHLFRNIQRSEYQNLFDFISNKGLKIMNVGDGANQPSLSIAPLSSDDEDPHMKRIRDAQDESDEEDEDFVLDKDDGGSPTDDSGEDQSDASVSGDEKENTKKENPGIAFLDIGKVLGEKWRKMSAEEKEPYEAKARADKKRYSDEIGDYKNPQPANADSGNESDSEE